MNFLPENYQAPKATSNFWFKPQDGENRIRILSRPIIGWVDWTLDKKPLRFTFNEKPSKPIDPKKPVKHFWAFIVWNVNLEQIQIYEITQASIRKCIEDWSKDSDWGSPFDYDIKINRKGSGIDTEYTLINCPKKPVSSDVIQAFKERPIQLEAMFMGADPFSTEWKCYTPLMPDAEEAKIQPIQQVLGELAKPIYTDHISDEQFVELSELLQLCSADHQKGFNKYLLTGFSVDNLFNLKTKDYEVVKEKLVFRSNEYQKKLAEAEMKDTPESRGKK